MWRVPASSSRPSSPARRSPSRGSCAAGRSRLAIFDKPDPLDGPFFEETIYVTPSRKPAEVQAAIVEATAAACRALGLSEGPIHAELRLPPPGPLVLEVAARSIGGLCSRALRFGAGLTLEEVLVSHAMGLALAFIDLSGMSKNIQPLVPALQSNWLLAHVMMSFIAYALFAISFSTGLMYLIVRSDERTEGSYIFWTVTLGIFAVTLAAMGIDYLTFKMAVKSQEEFIKGYLFRATFRSDSAVVALGSIAAAAAGIFLIWRFGGIMKKVITGFNISADALDELTYKSIAIGFRIFTLGGLIFGAIWADQAWGKYWTWDPKETWSLITWFFYAFYLHSRLMRGWKGRKVAAVAVLGFVLPSSLPIWA